MNVYGQLRNIVFRINNFWRFFIIFPNGTVPSKFAFCQNILRLFRCAGIRTANRYNVANLNVSKAKPKTAVYALHFVYGKRFAVLLQAVAAFVRKYRTPSTVGIRNRFAAFWGYVKLGLFSMRRHFTRPAQNHFAKIMRIVSSIPRRTIVRQRAGIDYDIRIQRFVTERTVKRQNIACNSSLSAQAKINIVTRLFHIIAGKRFPVEFYAVTRAFHKSVLIAPIGCTLCLITAVCVEINCRVTARRRCRNLSHTTSNGFCACRYVAIRERRDLRRTRPKANRKTA